LAFNLARFSFCEIFKASASDDFCSFSLFSKISLSLSGKICLLIDGALKAKI
tara:strand:+ start:226 stop:381 length:156 start_codon:yes stop_codon:yes gene_type:complete